MAEIKTISDSEFNNYKNLLEEYKTEREILKQNYHDRSKILTSKIHELEHIITKEDGIRNKRGKYWIDYKKEEIFKLYERGESIKNIANKFETTETNTFYKSCCFNVSNLNLQDTCKSHLWQSKMTASFIKKWK